MAAVVIVEDDPHVLFLIDIVFSRASRFTMSGVATSADDGFEIVRRATPAIIVLDHGLPGRLTGFAAARTFRELAPEAKIILLTAHDEFHPTGSGACSIDAFVLKTNMGQLLPVAQGLMGFGEAVER